MLHKRTIYTAILALLVLLLASGCNYNRFHTPQEKEPAPLPVATHTIADLKAMYKGRPTTLAEDIVIRGVVSTDDRKGNFYRSIHIQDLSGGIELKMGMSNMSLLYRQGKEVAVLCRNLVLGKYGDMVTLGFPSDEDRYENSFVPELIVPKVMLAGNYKGVDPEHITLDRIDKSRANMLIKIEELQFVASELGNTYADPKNKSNVSAVNRTLIDKSGQSIILRTSSYAAFAGKKLPEGSGSVVALLTFFRDTPQLVISDDIKDIRFTKPRFN